MISARLNLAREQGLLALPEGGRICVFGARGGDDLSALGGRVQVVQGFRPDVDALRARGLEVDVAANGDFAAALVILPRAKAQAQDMIARAADLTDGALWIDGQKTDGADSMIRALRKRGTVDAIVAKAHGKLFRVVGADVADWRAQHRPLPGGFVTWPGVFSADGVDRGSALLADALPALTGTVVDLGGGWGYLARRALESDRITELHLVEADHAALECARANLIDPRVRFHWADALTFDLSGGADHVITNPPFHTARAPDTTLGRGFIAAAARLLKPAGQLWLVANRHLPYEAELGERFVAMTDLSRDPAFKVIHAQRPRRSGRKTA